MNTIPKTSADFTSAKVSGGATPWAMPAASVILAIDLGKYKCVPCVHDRAGSAFRWR
ncbi:MAG: hypothetical protein WCL32_01545 [Planctomycetota bacterium]